MAEGGQYPVDRLFTVVWGPIKTLKTTMLLTSPTPLVHLDFDGGIDRAIWRFPNYKIEKLWSPVNKEHFDQLVAQGTDIISIQYRMPLDWPGQKKRGYLELVDNITSDIFVASINPDVKTIGVDTGSILWRAEHQAHLERVQGRSAESTRQSLLPVEYARPNSDMHSLHQNMKELGKNIISIHHVGGIYNDVVDKGSGKVQSVRVGDTWEGWNKIGNMADVICQAYFPPPSYEDIAANRQPLPKLFIQVCGLTLEAQGISTLMDFGALRDTINALRTL